MMLGCCGGGGGGGGSGELGRMCVADSRWREWMDDAWYGFEFDNIACKSGTDEHEAF